MRSKLALLLCGAIVAMLSGATSCRAQMAQCNGLTGGTSYKVLIDEIQYATTTGNQPVLSIELIQSSVEGALEKVRRGILNHNATQDTFLYLNCKGRHPQAASDFDNDLVRNLAENHAILEFWGTLFPLGGGQHKFDIHYVLFPVAFLAPPAPSGIASTEKTMATKPTPEEVRQFLISTRADLPAYFTAAAGVQAYADHNLDQALRFLCEARTRLKKNPDQQELMKFVDELASKAAVEQRRNDNKAASLLTETQAKDYCSFATTR
jgi:hypothetical protein